MKYEFDEDKLQTLIQNTSLYDMGDEIEEFLEDHEVCEEEKTLSNYDKIKIAGINMHVEVYDSSNRCYLAGDDDDNARIFEKLKISNKMDFVSGIIGYKAESGTFPEVKSLEDLQKVIDVLKSIAGE